jgi:hypothetical protein
VNDGKIDRTLSSAFEKESQKSDRANYLKELDHFCIRNVIPTRHHIRRKDENI